MKKITIDELNLPDFFVFFTDKPGKEKITIGPIDVGKHLTFHFGTRSKAFDIHIKDEKNSTYETIITIRYFSIFRLYLLIKDEIIDLINRTYSHYINLGKLRRYNCLVQPLTLKNDLSKILKINENKNKIKFVKSINIKDFKSMFLGIDNIFLDCDSHFVYRVRKGGIIANGMIFKRIDKKTDNSFIYISKKKLNLLRIKILKILIENIVSLKSVESEKLLQIFNNKLL